MLLVFALLFHLQTELTEIQSDSGLRAIEAAIKHFDATAPISCCSCSVRVWERWAVHTPLLWPLVNCPFKCQLNPAVYLIQVQLELVAGLQVVGHGDPMDHVAPRPDHRLHRKEHVLRDRKEVES